MSKVLLALDTDQIKRYVFATGKLKEIRGASRILAELNENKTSVKVKGEKIYALGGSGLFVVDNLSAAEQATRDVKRLYAESTAGAASISAATVELPDDFDQNNDDIRPYWKLLARKLDLIKMQKTTPHTILTFPYLRHCDSCGEHGATKEHDDQMVCPVCLTKRQKSDSLPKDDVPQTFEDIGEASNPAGYFALLYVDGDGFGAEIEKCETLPQIREFAETVDSALRQSWQTARARQQIRSHSFNVLLQGGDDLVIALQAQYAFEAAHQIVVEFHERTKSLSRDLRVSAAVVWAHVKFPFASFLHLTESTLRFAKKHGRGRINFLVVSNANHLDFKKYYKNDLAFNGDVQTPKVIRTRRPYTPEALCQLLKVRRSDILKDAPRTKIQQLRQAVFQPTHSKASLESILALSHWRNLEQRKYFINLPSQFLEDGESTWIFPWTKRGEELRTPFADLAEIYDFTKGDDHAAPNE